MAVTLSGHRTGPVRTRYVPGTESNARPRGRAITARPYALRLLLDFLRRWQLDPVLGGGRLTLTKGGPLDSYSARPARAGGGKVSDHAGFAIDIRYDILLADNREHMTRAENEAVRRLLADYGGAIAWGGPTAAASRANPGRSVGQYSRLIDEMHFYLAPGWDKARSKALAKRLGVRANGTRTKAPQHAKPRTLRVGDHGPDVRALRRALGQRLGRRYTRRTAQLVDAFVRRHPGLAPADGTAGPKTQAAILAARR